MARDLTCRSTKAEKLDAPGIGLNVMTAYLEEMDFINRLTLASRPVMKWLKDIVPIVTPDRFGPLAILDIGCGSGAMMRRIWRWADKRDIAVEITGLDQSAEVLKVAESKTPVRAPLSYIHSDILTFEPARTYDLVLCSYVTHHLTDPDIVGLLHWLDRYAAEGWFINDLYRHPLAWWGAQILAHWPGRHPMVRHDAPLSVARAFTEEDWRQLLGRAHLLSRHCRIARYFPYRLGVSWQVANKGEIRHDNI